MKQAVSAQIEQSDYARIRACATHHQLSISSVVRIVISRGLLALETGILGEPVSKPGQSTVEPKRRKKNLKPLPD